MGPAWPAGLGTGFLSPPLPPPGLPSLPSARIFFFHAISANMSIPGGGFSGPPPPPPASAPAHKRVVMPLVNRHLGQAALTFGGRLRIATAAAAAVAALLQGFQTGILNL